MKKAKGLSPREREINRLLEHVIIMCYGHASKQDAKKVIESTDFDDDIKIEVMRQVLIVWTECGLIKNR